MNKQQREQLALQHPHTHDADDADDTAATNQHSLLIPKSVSPHPQLHSHAHGAHSHHADSTPRGFRAVITLPRQFFTILHACPLHLHALLLLLLIALIDYFVRPPHGLLPLRLLLSLPTHAPPVPCGWDYEASWKLGLVRGNSPLTLSFTHTNSTHNPLFTCAHIADPPVSFVADPFLSRHPVSGDWYLWFEMKNLAKMRGEIGVARSVDGLVSFEHVGTALTEPFHLSYPVTLWDASSERHVMIPECSGSRSIRVYTCNADSFPLGWSHHSTPLAGRRYVDTSPIFYHGQWHVFVTTAEDASLHLYLTHSLLSSNWQPHPLSPVLTHNRRHGRSAGRPFLYDGRIVRLAQDDSVFYGSAVYFIEVEEVSPTAYRERVVREMLPGKYERQGSDWVSERVHHADVHQLSDGEWVAMVDGDDKYDDYEFWQREGWWKHSKEAVLALLSLLTAIAVQAEWKRRQLLSSLPSAIAARRYSESLPTSAVLLVTSRLTASLHDISPPRADIACVINIFGRLLAIFLACATLVLLVVTEYYPLCYDGWSSYALTCPLTESLRQQEQLLSLPPPPQLAARLNLTALPSSFAAVEGDKSAFAAALQTLNWREDSASFPAPALPASYPPLPAAALPPSTFSPSAPTWPFFPLPSFVLVTAASSSYFDRLQNFIGSLHFFEPAATLLVYDLSLTPKQRHALQCMQSVTVVDFPFQLYPRHVRNLYNYAWKLLMLELAFNTTATDAVLLLDSGVELRRPYALSDIKRQVVERGYWLAKQSNTIDRKTRKETWEWLGVSKAAIKGKSFCAGGLNGFLRNSAAYREVLLPAIACAKDDKCIAPEGSGRATHNFDQSVLSVLVWSTGRRCDERREYHEWDMSLSTDDETNYNHIVLNLRRWHQPKPYIRHIRQVVSTDCPFVPALARPLIDYPPAAADDVLAMQEADIEAVLIQHKDGQHLQADSELVECLRRHDNSRWQCREELARHEAGIVRLDAGELVSTDTWWDVKGWRTLRRVRCANNWILAAVLTAACWYWHAVWLWLKWMWHGNGRAQGLSCVALLIVLIYPFYMSLVNNHGMFNVLAVAYLTRLYTPPSPYPVTTYYSDAPPAVESIVRPPFRIVFSMSTLPHQVAYVNETLTSLAQQVLKPDAIYLNLPYVNRRTNTVYVPPDFLTTGSWLGVPLYINRGEDVGPLTKLVPTLAVETDPSTVIITCDTDKRYPSTLSLTLAQHTAGNPTAAYGACGWGFLFRPAPVGVVPVYVPWAMRGTYGRQVDVLQAVCGNAYRRSFFPAVNTSDFAHFATPHVHCHTTDDLWIAGWLAARADVPMVLVPGGWSMWDDGSVEPRGADWKKVVNAAERRSSGSSGKWDLSSINSAAGVDMACIRGVEQSVGPWRDKRWQSLS